MAKCSPEDPYLPQIVNGDDLGSHAQALDPEGNTFACADLAPDNVKAQPMLKAEHSHRSTDVTTHCAMHCIACKLMIMQMAFKIG